MILQVLLLLLKLAVYSVDVDEVEAIVTLTKISILVSIEDEDQTYIIDASSSSETCIIAKDKTSSEYQVKLTLVDGVVTEYYTSADSGANWEKYTDIKEGSGSDDTTVSFGEDYIGTWTSEDSTITVVITESTFTYAGNVYEVSGDEDEGYSFTTTNAQGHPVTAYFFVDEGTLTINVNGSRTNYTKQA